MKHLRLLAVAAPVALLIGPAAPAPAARAPAPAVHAPAPDAATTVSATCRVPAPDEVVTAEESIRRIQQCRKMQAKSWHWMGNYGSVNDVVNAANGGGIGAGELITEANPSGSGLLPTFMYY
jgi:hypothetical protein